MGDTFQGKTHDRFGSVDPSTLSSEINIKKEFISQIVDADDDEMPVSVFVGRTTFTAVYGIVSGFVELVSPDLGQGRVSFEGRPPQQAAEELLRTMAIEEVARTEIPFMPDYGFEVRKLVTGGVVGTARPATLHDVVMKTCRVPWVSFSRMGMPMTEDLDEA